jgi:hypothetical protein
MISALLAARITRAFEIVPAAAMGGAGLTLMPMLWSSGFTVLRNPLAARLAGRLGAARRWWVIGLTAVARGAAMLALRRGAVWERVRG